MATTATTLAAGDNATISMTSRTGRSDDVAMFVTSVGDRSSTHGATASSETTLPSLLVDVVGGGGDGLPVIGLPGPTFIVIHGVALFSLTTTVLISISLIVYMCAFRKSIDHHHHQSDQSQQSAKNGAIRRYAVDSSTDSTELSCGSNGGHGGEGTQVSTKRKTATEDKGLRKLGIRLECRMDNFLVVDLNIVVSI